MDILIKFPTRGRPQKFREQFGRYYQMLSNQIDTQFVISMDVDDTTMNNPQMKRFLDGHNNQRKIVHYHYGLSRTKIQAINADMDKYPEYKIVLLASDDMMPVEHGYDKIIYDDMMKYYLDLDGVLHYNDGRVGKRLNTLSIMGIKMYERFGYIYHPAYTSLWCDNEFDDVTRALNKSTYIDRCIIKHEWVQFTGRDALHKKNEAFYDADQKIYMDRKRRGFPK